MPERPYRLATVLFTKLTGEVKMSRSVPFWPKRYCRNCWVSVCSIGPTALVNCGATAGFFSSVSYCPSPKNWK